MSDEITEAAKDAASAVASNVIETATEAATEAASEASEVATSAAAEVASEVKADVKEEKEDAVGSLMDAFKSGKKEKQPREKRPWTKTRVLEEFFKYFSYIYVCFCWATTVEYVCFGITDIRMSYFGYIWWYVFILGLLGACYGGRYHHRGVGWRGLLGSILCTALFAVIIYAADFNHMVRALGMFIKQVGFGFRFIWDINLMSWIFFWFYVIGGIVLLIYEKVHPAPPRQFEDAEEERRWKYQSRVKWFGFALIWVLVLVINFFPPVRDGFGYVFTLLSTGDINKVIEFIRSFGPWAALVSTFLMVFQSLAAPIPAFLITFSNAAVFGWFWGALLSWSSAMLAAAICFYIARFFGRDAVMLFMSRGALASVDRWFIKYGKNAILICRLLPFLSFDYISYAAGITGMGFWDFFIWTGIGQWPATIVYSYVGSTLTGQLYEIFMGMITIFVVAALIMFLRQVWKNKHKDLMDESNETADAENTDKRMSLETNAEGVLAKRRAAKAAKEAAKAAAPEPVQAAVENVEKAVDSAKANAEAPAQEIVDTIKENVEAESK